MTDLERIEALAQAGCGAHVCKQRARAGVTGQATNGPCTCLDTLRDEVPALVARCRAAEERVNTDARPCYYCGEMCEPLSANPSRWPVTLCHPDEPGRPKQHHVSCVSERLERLATAEARLCWRWAAGGS